MLGLLADTHLIVTGEPPFACQNLYPGWFLPVLHLFPVCACDYITPSVQVAVLTLV
jgi:hypothetical protein